MTNQLNDHFEFVDLKFDGGLWSVGDYLIPPNGAAQMQDCYPQLGGGLRAWADLEARSRAGVPDTHFPIAFFTRGGVHDRTGNGGSTDFYMMTGRHDNKRAYLWRWDETEKDTPYTEWELLKTFAPASSNAAGETIFQLFTPSSGETAVYFSFAWAGSSDQGIWRIDYDDGAVTQIEDRTAPRAFCIHQDRMIFGSSEAQSTRFRYSGLHEDTFVPDGFPTGAGLFDLMPDINLSDNAFARSFAGELLVGKQGAPLMLVQGDIFEPQLRILSDAHPPGDTQEVAEIPDGVVYAAYRDGYYVTRSGIDVAPLSGQLGSDLVAGSTAIRGTHTTTLGNPQFASPFLVTPSGHIFDYRTKAWFRTSEFGVGMVHPRAKHQHYDRHVDEHRVYVLTDEEDFSILYFSANESAMKRKRSYVYRSPAIRHPSGRRIVFREIQIPCRVFADGANVYCMVNGKVKQVLDIDHGAQVIRFPFNEEAEYLDVTIVMDSGADGTEAPACESVRPGTLVGHMLAPEPVTAYGVSLPEPDEPEDSAEEPIEDPPDPDPPSGFLIELDAGDLVDGEVG